MVSGPVDREVATADRPAVRSALRAAFAAVPFRLDSALWSGPLGLPSVAGGRLIRLARAAAPEQIEAHTVLVSGRWPGPPRPGQPIPVALPQAVAGQLGLGTGAVVAVRDRNTGAGLRLRVTGLFALRDPAARYGGLDLIGTSGVSIQSGFASYGPVLVSPAAFNRGALAVGQASWVALPDSARIQPGELAGLAARISQAGSHLQGSVRLGGLQIVSATAVTRTFGHGDTAVAALQGVSFAIGRGQLVALSGRSGSGKTTLLNIVGGLDSPTSGKIRISGLELTGMTERERMALRRGTVGFVFQSFGLIPMLSAAENVGLPLRIAGAARQAREERISLMLAVVGLSEHALQRPNELSGGQQQRVAIARALAVSPELLIADEPTGQLDSDTGRQIMRLLRTVVQSEGITALVATHDSTLLALADAVLRLEDGRLATTGTVAHH